MEGSLGPGEGLSGREGGGVAFGGLTAGEGAGSSPPAAPCKLLLRVALVLLLGLSLGD